MSHSICFFGEIGKISILLALKKNKKNLFGDVRRHGYETCILCRCIGSLLVKDGYEVTKDTFACLIIKIEDILCFGLL